MKSNNQGDKALNHEIFFPENLIFDSFWNAFGDLSIGIIVIDRKATVRFFNSMAGYFMGIQPLLVLGKPVRETLSETKITETLSTGIPHYDKERMINGKRLKCSSIPIKIQGKIVSAVEFMLDHTEKTSIMKQLKDQRIKMDD
jgi:two-component system sensor histidine kinase DctS